MWKFSSRIYIPARKMMQFKEQASVEMPLKVYKVPASQKAVPTRLKYQQHCDFLFCLYHNLVYNEPFTWLGRGQLPFPSFVWKGVFQSRVLDALYTRAFYSWCSQKSPRNSEDTFRTPQDQKLPVKTEGVERDWNSEGFKGKEKTC